MYFGAIIFKNISNITAVRPIKITLDIKCIVKFFKTETTPSKTTIQFNPIDKGTLKIFIPSAAPQVYFPKIKFVFTPITSIPNVKMYANKKDFFRYFPKQLIFNVLIKKIKVIFFIYNWEF